ncbi:hypothetical protein B0H12DRAFT_1235633 [Mycena haematopus]|nr:hypothetical protein B0H12DRAFT_1235633 [Mycena haematopus]
MVHASTLFFAVLAAAVSTASARPVFSREPAGFNVDTSCLGFNYLFGGPHHSPSATPDPMMTTRDHGADGAGIDIDLPSFDSIFNGSDKSD